MTQLEIFEHQSKDLVAADRDAHEFLFASRRCSNPECFAHVFVVLDLGEPGAPVLACYPAQQIELQSEGLPAPVRTSLLGAIRCHAFQCYIAAAMLVRKTIEEVCRYEGAEGDNLFQRIEALKEKVEQPDEVVDGALHALRQLGNDATHTEVWIYNEVGEQEVAEAIRLTQLFLMPIYTTKASMKKLEALKQEGADEE
jgi:hypothetical protein